ncbi:hypothetical protein UFOVP276_139 [uncultured Caudovirales phage]|uniref:Uncharacterized protein n=1 Tax=uncultured Caudovirales phage TaxID=2100421 RepID=A0A6J5LC32_9CAUD|nr:hypothetical protein UFOVP127_33 [uncultured Caudovirales phage]CAB4135183.1 hypothetical protein UFOVP276_139 [uncultured Caudovirales phage]
MSAADDQLAARNKRLDDLKKATDDWADKETTRLKNESAFLTSIVKGRTGAGKLTSQNVIDSTKLTMTSINQFLTG